MQSQKRVRRSVATSPPPRHSECGTSRGRLLAPGRVAHLPDPVGQWLVEDACYARYSGGAAPALHRFPWPPLVRSVVGDSVSHYVVSVNAGTQD